ncbi:MAG: DUF86 domain-containing protein [Spirochaetia bacterium]|nr:DUF86 domain-containing protein [Spirochaetia bacterium]
MRDYKIYIIETRENLVDIKKFVKDMNIEDFYKDKKTQNAVIRSFEVIGEAAKNIPKKVYKQYPDVPWKTFAGFRDRLIHAYFDINLDIVWRAVQQIDSLLEKLK